jgi:cell division protein FtsW
MGMLFLNGVPLWHLASCAIVAGLTFAIFILHNPVRLGRILSFAHIESTKLTGSYQLWQGLIGFHAGGWFGVGLGNGRQQLFYLPEAHTDFIFPILAEEWGYIFCLAVLIAYLAIFLLAWREACHIHSPFPFLMAMGIILTFTAQTLINLFVIVGLLPTKGMALPLLSYGGSSLVLTYALFGLLLNCFRSAYFEAISVESCQ